MFSARSRAHRYALTPVLTGLFLALCLGVAHAQLPAYSVSDWTYDPATGNYTLGFTFTPTNDVQVTALGEWVSSGFEINNSETVGIFDNAGNLLFSTPFTQANATLTSNTFANGGQFRYVDITSAFSESARTLAANQSYTLAGTIINNSTGTAPHGFSAAPDITVTSSGLYSNGDTLSSNPTPPSTDGGFGLYGINFEYTTGATVAATPEPGSFALLVGLAVSGGVFVRRRRKA